MKNTENLPSNISIEYWYYNPELELLLRENDKDSDYDKRLPPDDWSIETQIAVISNTEGPLAYFACDQCYPLELDKEEADSHLDRMIENQNPSDELVEEVMSFISTLDSQGHRILKTPDSSPSN